MAASEALAPYFAQLDDEKRFLAENPWPFLVRLPTASSSSNDWSDSFEFQTAVRNADDNELGFIVQPVRKRPGGPFPDRVGVGRARNCDVVLRYSSVSKLHAQFHIDSKPWQIVNLGSRNGTFVEDEQLRAQQARAIELETRLRFGSVDVELVSAKMLFDKLSELRRG